MKNEKHLNKTIFKEGNHKHVGILLAQPYLQILHQVFLSTFISSHACIYKVTSTRLQCFEHSTLGSWSQFLLTKII
jgi:hypothetical protein